VKHLEIFRFLISGILNTVFFYLIYFLGLKFATYQVAFLTAFILGILSSYCINTIFTFREKMKISTLAQYPLIYLIQYLTSITLLWLFVEKLGISQHLAPLMTTILNIPTTFLMSRHIIKRNVRAPS
jgi:putative flippase GtrA